ncbi:MAG: protein translocase subunit SecD [Acidimicrobiales bacterium]
MSPPSSRAQARRQRSLLLSLVIVVVVAFGSLAGVLAAGWGPKLGLDLAGGFQVVYQPVHPKSATSTDITETVDILTNRVNGLGVSGATVSTQGVSGTTNIVVSVPGVKDAQSVLRRIGKVGKMYFRPGLCYAPAYSASAASKASSSTTAPGSATSTPSGTTPTTATTTADVTHTLPSGCTPSRSLTTSNLKGSPGSGNGVGYTPSTTTTPSLAAYRSTCGSSAPNGRCVDNPKATVLLPGLKGTTNGRYLLGPAELTGKAVKKATAAQTQLGQWVVDVTLTSSGNTGWNAMAKKYFHEIIGIELDGVVQSAPITLPSAASFTTFTGKVQISGSFSATQAKTLALALNYGALPIGLKKITFQTVSPTLGHTALVAGLGAGIGGLVLVLIYTILYYRLLGIVVLSGLAVTAALLWAIISALGHTSLAPSFDLAGVTGIIVSIGITVDSYIVYFERLKDETRAGRTVRTSVDRGFRSAWRTVLAADLVSLAAAVVLYFVAVGTVKGFAFFLGLSTLMDIFMTYFFTRPLVILLGQNERLTNARRIGVSSGLAVGAGVDQ